MNTRDRGLEWLGGRHTGVERVLVSKFYPEHESWPGTPVWWFEFTAASVTDAQSFINLLCEDERDAANFHHLRVPVGVFLACRSQIGYREDVGRFSLFLSAEAGRLFREIRGSGGVEFGAFRVD